MEFGYITNSVIPAIHEFLNHNYTPWSKVGEEAFFVHADIIDQFAEKMNAQGITVNDENVWPIDLKIGTKNDLFNQKMYLVWLKHNTQQQVDFLFEFFASAIYSYPWEHSQNKLYLPMEQFDLIEEFIRKENVEQFVLKLRKDKERKFSRSDLKIVEFRNELVNRVTKEFGRYVTHDHEIQNSYFMVQSFQYFKPSYLEYLKKPLKNFRRDMIVIDLILEYNRNQAKNHNEVFDLFDIINMKLGIDDVRLEYNNCEFHKLINKMLTEMPKMYIKNREFNLAKYQSDRAILSISEESYQYLFYNFHHHFDRVIEFSNKNIIEIKLAKVNRIRDLSNNIKEDIKLFIDYSDMNENSSDILLGLMSNQKMRNISISMQFDTNFHWKYKGEALTILQLISYERPTINLDFSGSNEHNFIENFLNWLKLSWPQQFIYFRFTFLQFEKMNPYIFINFNIRSLNFEMIELNSELIRSLKRCNYEWINFSDCRLKNDDQNLFELLDTLDRVQNIFINNEENTCAYVMEQIMKQLSTKSEIRFKNSISLMPISLDFKDLIFHINMEGTKLEVYHLKYRQNINFYDYLYDDYEFSKREDFEFYS